MKEKKKLYIVEDSNLVVKRLTKMLSSVDCLEITGCSKGAEHAAASIKMLKPHIVLLDISLQSGSGLDVLIEIKKNDPPPMVIVFTNYCFPLFKEKCFSCGADYFFDKSSEFEKAVQIITNYN